MKKITKTTKEKVDDIIIDAGGKTLGRVAGEIAHILMGKNKVSFERNVYSGSPVKVINASKIRITPAKLENISHNRYSGYPGGLRVTKAKETVEKKGFKELIRLSVHHMLPGNKLRREMLKNLKIEE
jgi:large subunit ribosomal protein L13